jgi:hypothetical protein
MRRLNLNGQMSACSWLARRHRWMQCHIKVESIHIRSGFHTLSSMYSISCRRSSEQPVTCTVQLPSKPGSWDSKGLPPGLLVGHTLQRHTDKYPTVGSKNAFAHSVCTSGGTICIAGYGASCYAAHLNLAMRQDCLALLHKCLVGVQPTDTSSQGMQLGLGAKRSTCASCGSSHRHRASVHDLMRDDMRTDACVPHARSSMLTSGVFKITNLDS